MPFATIRVPFEEKVDLKDVMKKVEEKLGEKTMGLNLMAIHYDDQDWASAGKMKPVVVQLNIGERHGKEKTQKLLSAIIESLKEQPGIENVGGFCSLTPEGFLFIKGKFV